MPTFCLNCDLFDYGITLMGVTLRAWLSASWLPPWTWIFWIPPVERRDRRRYDGGLEATQGQPGNHKGCPYTVNAIFITMTVRGPFIV